MANADASHYLVCAVDAQRCALPLAAIIETMRPLPCRPVAGAPNFLIGLAIIRGTPTPVVDARAILTGMVEPNPGRFVTLRAREGTVALAVKEVLGVRSLDATSIAAAPPLLSGAYAGAIAAISARDMDLLLILETSRLVPAALWSALPAEQTEERIR